MSSQQSFLLKVDRKSVIDLSILFPILPKDIIYNIASYFTMKIPTTDSRYQVLDLHYRHNKNRVKERFWSEKRSFSTTEELWNEVKRFRGYIITFSSVSESAELILGTDLGFAPPSGSANPSNKKYELIIEWYGNEFISYKFENTVTKEYNCDRCWFKLEDMNWKKNSTNYWQQFFIDGWLPNPNTTYL